MSFEAAAQHLLRLSSRQFQDATTALVLYDVIARQHLFQSVTASVRASPNLNADGGFSFGEMSASELKAAAEYHDTCVNARRRGLPDPPLPPDMRPAVVSAIRSLSAHSGACEHSGENARRARTRMHGYNMALGSASWWLTVSSDDTTSVLVWQLAHSTDERPVRIPLPNSRFQCVSDNPVAAALAFERLLRLVLRCVVGWEDGPLRKVYPTQSEDEKQAGGMLGVCRAFVYAIETQGRGSLHAHILVWSEISLADNMLRLGTTARKAVHSCAQPLPQSQPTASQSAMPAPATCQLTDEEKSQMRQNDAVVSAMACVERLMEHTITRELCLPDDVHEQAKRCNEPDCKGSYFLQNENATLHSLRYEHAIVHLCVVCIVRPRT